VPRGPAVTRVFLDISRTLRFGRRRVPSGIDRVELAHARRCCGADAARGSFVATDLWGAFHVVDRRDVAALVEAIDEAWAADPEDPVPTRRAVALARRIGAAAMLGLGRRALRRELAQPGPKAFLLVSHRALERAPPIEAMRRAGAAFVPLIHDLIPWSHPEYARPGEPERHLERIRTTVALADGILVNSAATAAALAPHLAVREAPPPVRIAHLGVERRSLPPAPVPLEPYFVALGTIEPRKNHLLLLNLWRRFTEEMGPRAPRLFIVGRRGWENENVLDMLERCAALRPTVTELSELSDRGVAELLAGARALLFPSFAEGYGLPLAEALALGTPAICSDLPALREVGGSVPDYLDPLDGAAWRQAILDYARPNSPTRLAQLSRLAAWSPPGWERHFAEVEALIAETSGAAPRRAEAPATAPPAARRPALPAR
jgi:glycosyltransferase involved in cell wall biosynthesis